MSGLKYTALRQVADLWWQRKMPRGLLKGEPEAPEEPREASTEVAEESPHPSPAKAPEIPVMPASFIQHVVDQFNAAPGFRLRLEARPGEHRFVFVVTREGSDDVVASIDVARGQISDVRWLDSVRPGQQQALLDRLERALADAELADASNDDATVPNAASSLQPLIETIERMGHTYGMDLRGALDTSRKDPLHALAVALKDLAEPVTTSPEALAERLEEADLSSAAEVLQDPDVLAFASVEQILDRLWGALDKKVPLSKIKRRGGGLVVPPDAFFGTDDARFVLVRESGRGTRYRLRRVAIKAGSCKGDLCAIEAPAGELRSGAEVYDFINQRSEVWINDLHDQIAALEHTLRDAPRLLADVRQLLLLAGALIDTHRCQGKEQAAALRAFEQAKRYHDAARRMLVAGKTAVAAERIHAAMRRIATAAAHISEDCAAGQQNFIPAKLPVDAADAAALEES